MNEQSIPFVSVIIPVYNDPIRLKTCLQALEEQTYPKDSYEVIVVDNGSDESIEPIVAEYSQSKASIETHPGQFAARNTGISLAQGEVLAFTDSDCIPATDWIEKGVEKLLRVPNCGIVGGKVELFFKNSDHPTAAELYDSIMHFNQKLYIEKKNFSVTANLITFKHVFEHIGGFANDLKSSGDKEWGKRVASSGYRLCYADEVRVAHPARHSFKELRRKVSRIARWREIFAKKYGTRAFTFDREFFLSFLPPVLTVIRLRQVYHIKMKEQIEIILIWFAMKSITILSRLKVKILGIHRDYPY